MVQAEDTIVQAREVVLAAHSASLEEPGCSL